MGEKKGRDGLQGQRIIRHPDSFLNFFFWGGEGGREVKRSDTTTLIDRFERNDLVRRITHKNLVHFD